MVVSAPDFDETLSGHAAVEFDRQPGVVHAVVSNYTDEGHVNVTECGLSVDGINNGPRMEFEDEDIEYCENCWPSSVTELE